MQTPPSGTVTFLFTDIEGSIKLWQQHPDSMPEALARHHALLQNSFISHGGYVFQIIGDAFCSAFPTANDGLDAALAAQRALADEKWGETGAINVRMALHTGQAELRIGEYKSGEYISGLSLSRAARILSAGHGGQILVSLPTAELLRDQLPPDITLRDLGARRLKDLIRPEQIFQVVAPGLRTDFEPLKTLDIYPHNLPVQLSRFIGREREMSEIIKILGRVHLLTLTGIGGTGKTRLALQVSAELVDEFPEGIWLVELASLSDPMLLPQRVAAVLGLRERPDCSLLDLLVEYIHDKNLLIVLDNCEHIVGECAQFVEKLLHIAPKVKILATSRSPLNLAGETIYPIPPLSLPNPNAESPLLAPEKFEAVRLFIDRAMSARPDFRMTTANSQAIVKICQHLDGIPLAIELVTARLRAFSVEQIAVRIDDRFRLLTGGYQTSLPRHQTLRGLIDWSYDLLAEKERVLFQRLAVFEGGWDLDAVESTCSGEGIDRFDVFDLLAHLVDRSLVMLEEVNGETRYRLLETLHQYAQEALEESGWLAFWLDRHMRTYLKLAEQADLNLRSAADIVWIKRLEKDKDNLRLACKTAMQQADGAAVLRFGAALYYFWYRRGYIQEALEYLQQATHIAGVQQHPLELARLLAGLGLLYWLNGNFTMSLDSLNRSIDLLKGFGKEASYTMADALFYSAVAQMRLGYFTASEKAADDSRRLFEQLASAYGLANTYYALGRIWLEQGQVSIARPYLQNALDYSRRAGDRLIISLVLNSLELLAISDGDFDVAKQMNQESLALAEEMEDNWMVSAGLREAGNITQATGDYQQAAELFTRSAELSKKLGLFNDLARARFNQGCVSILRGEHECGQAFLRESWRLFSQLKNRRGQSEVLDGWALEASAKGACEAAAQLQGTADASLHALGVGRWPVDLLEYHKVRSALIDRLGEERYRQFYDQGRNLSLEDAMKKCALEL